MTTKTEVMTRAEQMPEVQSATLTPMDMIDRALANGAGVEVMEKLMALQERWESNQGRKAFDHAISAAKSEIPPIIKNREVDFTSNGKRTNYRHEDLAGIAKVVDPILAKNGLSYRYRSTQEGGTLTVTCVLSHEAGYSEETSLSGPNDQTGNKNAHQAVGSAATYLQRYTLKLALGLAVAADDDGQAAGKPVETITDEQATELRRLLEAAGRDEQAMCNYYRVGSLDLFPADKFGAAVKQLKAAAGERGAK